MAKKEEKTKPQGMRVQNRKARHNYHLLEVVECGMALVGTEVKSLRDGGANLEDAYARVQGDEVFLIGMNIAPYQKAAPGMGHEPLRDRKLLLHRKQVEALQTHVRQKGKTLVPLTIYFKNGWAKCELGVAIGKKQFDKRDSMKERDQKRDISREMNRRRRGGM